MSPDKDDGDPEKMRKDHYPTLAPPVPSSFDIVDMGPRQPVFDFYKDSPHPMWGVTVRLDVTKMRRICQEHDLKYLHASLYIFSLTANQYAPIRYRIRTNEKTGEKFVVCHTRVHPTVTLLRRDGTETYGYSFWQATDNFTDFATYATAAEEDFHSHSQGLDGNPRDDVLHGSVLPWLDFISYEHAIGRLSMPSIPKYTFGKLVEDETTGKVTQSLALHVHHGLMDGLHVGRFVEKLQQNLDQAEDWILKYMKNETM
jgi:chloramphenicol O-acetyltransferase type A